MIQDIYPKVYNNQYRKCEIQKDDRVIFCRPGFVYGIMSNEKLGYPKKKDVDRFADIACEIKEYRYLFAIDEEKFFLPVKENHMDDRLWKADELTGLSGEFFPSESFRRIEPAYNRFAGVTALQLFEWYRNSRYCGRCGKPLLHDETERMMRCPDCGNMVYPRISPAVIVGVINNDRILMTKYAGRGYKKYALVAGFNEIGENLEETVKREVMEETGIKVKNIRYYKSQPWSLSGTVLMGFFCDLDGDDSIVLDRDELSVALWMSREEMLEKKENWDDGITLTREMMQYFLENRI